MRGRPRGSKTQEVTIPELRRMKELADLDIPCGSIAKLVSHEFATSRDANSVRSYLRRYYAWRSARATRCSA